MRGGDFSSEYQQLLCIQLHAFPELKLSLYSVNQTSIFIKWLTGFNETLISAIVDIKHSNTDFYI